MRRICPLGTVLCITVACLLYAGTSQTVFAAEITVSTTSDTINTDGACSLREALNNANNNAATYADCTAGSGDDTIIIPAGTYCLTDVLAIEDNVTMNGAGANETILDGGNSTASNTTCQTTVSGDRILAAYSSSVSTVNLTGLTIMGGKPRAMGVA
jgi:hypothetical protein